MYINGELVETSKLPSNYIKRKDVPFWKYQLPKGKHVVQLKILNQTDQAEIKLDDLIVYSDTPMKPKY